MPRVRRSGALEAAASPRALLELAPLVSIGSFPVPACRQELVAQTDGKCRFMEGAFEETFDQNTLNLTRWKDSSIHGACDGVSCLCLSAVSLYDPPPPAAYPQRRTYSGLAE